MPDQNKDYVLHHEAESLMRRGLSEDVQREILRLLRKDVVETDAVTEYHKVLDNWRSMREPARVTGVAGTGKTCASQAYCASYPPFGTPRRVPTIYLLCDESWTSADLNRGILTCLGSRVVGGPLRDLRRRAREFLVNSGVELLFLDEADRLRREVFADVRQFAGDALRIGDVQRNSDTLHICVVLIGTTNLNTALLKDEPTNGRFKAHYTFQPLTHPELADTIAIWEDDLLRLPEPSNLRQEKICNLLMLETRGNLRSLDKILRLAAVRSLGNGENKITLQRLQSSIDSYKSGWKPIVDEIKSEEQESDQE